MIFSQAPRSTADLVAPLPQSRPHLANGTHAASRGRATLPGPGILRVRPLPLEATASYLGRVAGIYHLTLPQFLGGLGITLAGAYPGTSVRSSDIYLNTAAQHRIAAFAAMPLRHLARALPHFGRHTGHATDDGIGQETGPAVASWQHLEPSEQTRRACTACTAQRGGGIAFTLPHGHQRLCVRHQQWAASVWQPGHLNVRALPELTRVYHANLRLLRRPEAAATYRIAATITNQWHRHHQHLAPRWQARLRRLAADNQALRDQSPDSSPARQAHDAITYPETIALTVALATLPRTPAGAPPQALGHIAAHLQLTRFTPVPRDPVWNAIPRHMRH